MLLLCLMFLSTLTLIQSIPAKRSVGTVELWPGGIIPFTVADGFSQSQRSDIDRAMRNISLISCVKFEARRAQSDYVKIGKMHQGCSAVIGKKNGARQMNLGFSGCFNHGEMLHTLMHVMGFDHEHARSDRDYYVDINFGNIKNGTEPNFQKRQMGGVELELDYDYGSIMHYPKRAYSRNNQDTIIPINPRGAAIGQRDWLSAGDIAKINKVYNCPTY